jgi:hypothetical protein
MGKAANIAAALAAVSCMALAPAAQAQRWGQPHSRIVIGVGVPIGWGYWPYWHYPPPYAYYPYYARPADPVIYVEKGDADSAPGEDPAQFWYFCRDSKTYFPYVKECPTPWQRVVPQSPPG